MGKRRSRKEQTAEDIIRRYHSGYREFPGVIIIETFNLSRKRLYGINFDGATLMGCDFSKSYMKKSNFNAANLRNANLKGVDLSKATLTGADFRGASLQSANLSGADFRWANLEGVNLAGANISGANFDGANLKNANLKDTNPGKLWWKANLQEAKLEGTILPDGTVFGQALTGENK